MFLFYTQRYNYVSWVHSAEPFLCGKLVQFSFLCVFTNPPKLWARGEDKLRKLVPDQREPRFKMRTTLLLRTNLTSSVHASTSSQTRDSFLPYLGQAEQYYTRLQISAKIGGNPYGHTEHNLKNPDQPVYFTFTRIWNPEAPFKIIVWSDGTRGCKLADD